MNPNLVFIGAHQSPPPVIAQEGHRARRGSELSHKRIGITASDRVRHRFLAIEQKGVGGLTGQAVEGNPHIEQHPFSV